MKRFYDASHPYLKIYFPLVGIYLLFTLSIGFVGFEFLNTQYTQELRLLSNIAGAVLSEHPDLEETLLDAIQDTEGKYTDQGLNILNKYGYGSDLSMYDDIQYRDTLTEFLSLCFLFIFLSLFIITVCFTLLDRKHNKQEKYLLTLLDHFLSEDYSSLEQRSEIHTFFDDAFTDALLKLGHKLRLKTQMLSEERDTTKTLVTDISHQLKTPVSALKNCLAMSMEADSPIERDAFLERCSLQLTKLEALMENLINISRLETSLIILHQTKSALSDILLDAVNTVYVKALQKTITIEVLNTSEPKNEDSSSDLVLSLDRKWTTEALANILDNAIKYSPAKSVINVRLSKLYSYVRIEIEDAGIGIPKNEYNKIFKRFYRGQHPTVQQYEGSGVGLYLSRRIIEEQGGSITVKPAVRQGSIFVVQLPLSG